MKIRIHYTTQLKMALGFDWEEVEVPPSSTLLELLKKLREIHPGELEQYILNAQGDFQPTVLLCVGDKHVGRDLSVPLRDGEEVTLLSVISGG